MTEKKKSLLPKFEMIIIVVFFFSFLIWGIGRCGDIRQAAAERLGDETADAETIIDSIRNSTLRDTVYITRNDTTQLTNERVYGRLYITINNLKIRKEPGLKSDVLGQLPLFAEVTFLDEVTDSTFQINLGYETADEPYVKIRTPKGTEGWVYGAGVNYYKKKRDGVLE